MNVFVGAVIDVEGLSSGDRGRVQSRCARTAECVAVGMRSEYRCGLVAVYEHCRGMRDPLAVYMN